MRTVLVGLVAFALLAGCLDDAEPSNDATVEDVAPAAPMLAWANETVSGSVKSIGTPVISANPGGFAGEEVVFDFSVPQNSTQLMLDFAGSANVPTTEAKLEVSPAGCEMALEGSDCETEVVTEGLVANLSFEDPAPGTWQFRLFVENGADEVAFDLMVAALAPMVHDQTE